MYIDEQGNKWYKGNLHTHTTQSDGKISPDECIELYRNSGYDFLAITDHWKLSKTEMDNGMLLLAGCEYDVGKTSQEGIFHIVGIGMTDTPDLQRKERFTYTPQDLVDGINSKGGIAFLAHPAWSINRVADVAKIKGIVGVEIFNTASDTPKNCRPYSGCFVDSSGVEGVFYNCLATDDSHWYEGEHCKSYIMVKADSLSREDILEAISKGDFYATQGPNFSYKITDGKITITTTPAKQVVFASDTVWANDRVTTAKDGEFITTATYELKSTDSFIRFEITDDEGKVGWSHVIGLI